jgi:hypothetical protein
MASPQYTPMKVAVLNLSGNVGKTTTAIHLLAAYRKDAKLISVETINNTEATSVASLDVEELSASQFKHIYTELLMADDVIVDVGASNVSKFMEELTRFKSAQDELDLIVIPTVPADKQQKDTVATIEWLAGLGIPASKIRVVYNQYFGDVKIAETYAYVYGYSISDGKAKANWAPPVVVDQNEVFELVKRTGKTIRELASDTTDWKGARKAAKEAKDMDAALAATDGQMAHDLARAAAANLEKAYEDLMSPFAKASKK